MWTACLSAAVAIAAGAMAPALASDPDPAVPSRPPFPLDERLRYRVSWMGIHCGSMTLSSFADGQAGDTIYHIVMIARSSDFFDGIYKVRSRIESWYSGRLMSSVRYHDISSEKRKVRDDLFEFDYAAGQVVRTRDGEQEVLALDAAHVHDPLAYLYRLRALATDSADEMSLVLATTKGPLATVARVVERRSIKTPFGRQEALRVVPQPEDGMLFSRSGQMAVWLGADDQAVPYRVEFDLSFGKLVAKLVEVGGPEEAATQEEADPQGAPTGAGSDADTSTEDGDDSPTSTSRRSL